MVDGLSEDDRKALIKKAKRQAFQEALEEFNRLEARMESMRSSWPMTDYQNWLQRNADVDDLIACAHLRIVYKTEELPTGFMRGLWQCDLCQARFVPKLDIDWLVEALEGLLAVSVGTDDPEGRANIAMAKAKHTLEVAVKLN